MGSMAFWYDKNPDVTNVKLDAVMNFNLWTQCDTDTGSFPVPCSKTNSHRKFCGSSIFSENAVFSTVFRVLTF